MQELRASSSAVITGIGTVLADDPNMDVRIDAAERQPLRVVLDSHLQMAESARIIGDDGQCHVFTLSQDEERIDSLSAAGVEVIVLSDLSSGRINLSEMLSELGKWQCNEVLIEAGSSLSGAFIESGLVDELALFYAGSILGDKAQSMFQFEQPVTFDERTEFVINSTEMIGPDVFVQALNQQSWQLLNQA